MGEALAQVSAVGTEAVSLRQVAQAVGVSPSAAYAHFPDKGALMTAVARRGMTLLDERMFAAAASVPGTSDDEAIERFSQMGLAYVRFALEQPHLFRHVFGPYCAAELHLSETDPQLTKSKESGSYALLCAGLDDLDARGLLRPGIREGLDVVVWTTVHGFASLVLDGLLPAAATELLLDTMGRLIGRDS